MGSVNKYSIYCHLRTEKGVNSPTWAHRVVDLLFFYAQTITLNSFRYISIGRINQIIDESLQFSAKERSEHIILKKFGKLWSHFSPLNEAIDRSITNKLFMNCLHEYVPDWYTDGLVYYMLEGC